MSFNVETGVECTPGTFARCGHAEETNRLPVGTVFDLLADARRRHLLYYLIEEAGGEAGTTEVADHLCDVAGGTVAQSGSADPESILVDLRHRHLPKMEAAGLVEVDREEGAVRYVEDPLVEDCLARVAARDFGRQQ